MHTIEIRTYSDVGRLVGLQGDRLKSYIRYMIIRWADTEERKCKNGTAEKEARDWLLGYEYFVNDVEGREILREQFGYTKMGRIPEEEGNEFSKNR